ncbi:MAG TPA: acyltransferase [Waterburya sp.]|jgi:acetyltransferase-like isoleucine patch superfamily enzyme
MALIRKLIREFLWLLSEIEAHFSDPNDVLYFRRLYFRWQKVKHHKILWVGRGLRLLHPENLVLGKRCAFGDFVQISNHASIVIGDDFIGSTGLHINSGTHDSITLEPKLLPIQIGHRVWCGINVTILAGVTIGDDVILGAGSVVCHDIPSNSIAVGVPAKVIKPLVRDLSKPLWTWTL